MKKMNFLFFLSFTFFITPNLFCQSFSNYGVMEGDGTGSTTTLYTTKNVGIGTSSPSGKLHLSTGTLGDCILRIESDTDNNNEDDNPLIQFYQDNANTIGEIGLTGSNGQVFTGSLANSLYMVNKEYARI